MKKVMNLKNNELKVNEIKKSLKSKAGDDKLVITLVLVALGVGLCIIYRNTISSIMVDALATLKTQVTNLFAGTVTK